MIRYTPLSLSLAGVSLLAGGLLASPAMAEPQRYVVDEEHVSIGFLAGHARFADVLGLFTEVSGEFVYDAEAHELQSGTAEIAADSVFTGHNGRDGHVREDDFLAAGAHPVIRFEATDYVARDARTGTVQGEITIRGVTRPLSLEATINRIDAHPIGGAETLGASLRGSLRRSEFGMDYALEGDLVSDRIELLIEFEAIREDG